MRLRPLLCACAVLVLASNPLDAQLSIEGRAGTAIGNHRAAAAGLQIRPRTALAASIEYAATPVASIYAGYNHMSFACRDGYCSDKPMTFTSHGFAAGVILESATGFRFRGGLIHHRVDAANTTARAGLGFEGGVGYRIRLGERVSIRPEIGVHRHGATTGDVEGPTTVLTAMIGVALRLGRPWPGRHGPHTRHR